MDSEDTLHCNNIVTKQVYHLFVARAPDMHAQHC